MCCCLCLMAGVLFTRAFCAEEHPAYDPKGKRNPFVPLVTPDGRLLQLEAEEGGTVQPKALSLEGIIYDKGGLSYAIVNGAVVKIGDSVGEFQVLKIEKNRVTFAKEGQAQTIELKEDKE